MFYKNKINELEVMLQANEEDANQQIKKVELEQKTINEKLEAIIECLRNDRKDINALINIYKNLNKTTTKRKK